MQQTRPNNPILTPPRPHSPTSSTTSRPSLASSAGNTNTSLYPPKPQQTFPPQRTRQRPDVLRLRVYTSPPPVSSASTTATTQTQMKTTKSAKQSLHTTQDLAYTPTAAKLAWQRKMQVYDVGRNSTSSSIPGVGLSPACLRERTGTTSSVVGTGRVTKSKEVSAGIDDDNQAVECFDFEELCRRARTLSGRYDNDDNRQEEVNHVQVDHKPPALPRSHTFSSGERVHYVEPAHKLKAMIAHPNTINTTQSATTPMEPPTTTSSPSSKGWWDVLKSPFFTVTPISSDGPGSQLPSPDTPASVLAPVSSISTSMSLPFRLPPPVPTRVPVPTSIDVDGKRLKPPAFVAVVMEAKRLESERRAKAGGADRQTMSPLLGAALEQDRPKPANLLSSSSSKQEAVVRDYFSQKTHVRPSLPRSAQTLPARLGKTLAPPAAATSMRPRKEIVSTSFVQAVLELDAQEKQEKKMRVKRKKMKIFEEEEEDWEFKCCGVDDGDEVFAGCVVDAKVEKVQRQVEDGVGLKTVTALKRRPTVKELRSGSSGMGAGEGQGDDRVRGGSERRRKLVRWWTNLS